MNTEELAFVNRQLAGMLASGIPLEAGLKKMTRSMGGSRLKGQLEQLADRLEKGQPVKQAVDGLDLPDTYKQLLVLGQQGQSMPSVLNCVADFYERISSLTTRLRGLSIYPTLILVCGIFISVLMAFLASSLRDDIADMVGSQYMDGGSSLAAFLANNGFWLSLAPVSVMTLGCLFYLMALRNRKMRSYFSWKVPMLRDASLAQYAALAETLLASGSRLPEVVGLVRKLEAGSPVEADLAEIEQNLASGHSNYDVAARGCRVIPDFFNWIVVQAGEDVGAGFGHARTIYTSRAENKMQSFLYCFLPVNILLVGAVLLLFFLPYAALATDLIRMLETLGM